jgi:putative transposase
MDACNSRIVGYSMDARKNLLNRQLWASRHDLRLAIITWIETTYHRRRRQHALARLTPIEFETLHQAAHAACPHLPRPSQRNSGQTIPGPG